MIQQTPYFWNFLKFFILYSLHYSKGSLLCNNFFISLESSDFDIAAIQDLGGFRMPKIYCFCGRRQFLNKIKFYLQEFGLASWIWVKMFLVFKGLQEKALALSGSVNSKVIKKIEHVNWKLRGLNHYSQSCLFSCSLRLHWRDEMHKR